MLFNSLKFALFFPVVLVALGTVPRAWRGRVILLASLVFYGSFRWDYLVLMLTFSTLDWWVVTKMADAPAASRRWWLATTLTTNFGLLFVFKYWNMFNGTARDVVPGWPIPDVDLVMPLGISFYTFQTMGYAIDVYRGTIPPLRTLERFGLFVWYFPQHVSGPIERATHLLPQLDAPRDVDLETWVSALRLIGWAMFKKVVVADRLAIVVDRIYDDPTSYNGFGLLVAVVLFSFQLYCDFSGYSEIAMGVSRLMGVELMRNFDHPMHSWSMQEMWSRWHISLSTWFRDYLYFPLGGNRVSFFRWSLVITLVFAISGMWHGARWTFLFWGLAHGAILIVDRASKPLRDRVAAAVGLTGMRRGWVAIPLTQVVWIASLVPFRANTLGDLVYVTTHVFTGWAHVGSVYAFGMFLNKVNVEPLPFFFGLALIPFVFLVETLAFLEPTAARYRALPGGVRLVLDWVMWLSVLFFGVWSDSPFVYFQF